MKSEINPDFIELFQYLPERVKRTARKNYRPRKDNPYHPRLEFKEVGSAKYVRIVKNNT